MSPREIWKFTIPIDDRAHKVFLPGGGKFLAVGSQEDPHTVQVWAQVRPGAEQGRVAVLQVFGTGHPLPEEATYIGTVLTPWFVWHLMEVG